VMAVDRRYRPRLSCTVTKKNINIEGNIYKSKGGCNERHNTLGPI